MPFPCSRGRSGTCRSVCRLQGGGRRLTSMQIAIAKFFDGEGPDPLAEAQAAHDSIPRATARHENLHESLLDADARPHRPARRPQTEPAPRVVPQPSVLYRTPFLVSVLFAPFRFGYKLFTGL